MKTHDRTVPFFLFVLTMQMADAALTNVSDLKPNKLAHTQRPVTRNPMNENETLFNSDRIDENETLSNLDRMNESWAVDDWYEYGYDDDADESWDPEEDEYEYDDDADDSFMSSLEGLVDSLSQLDQTDDMQQDYSGNSHRKSIEELQSFINAARGRIVRDRKKDQIRRGKTEAIRRQLRRRRRQGRKARRLAEARRRRAKAKQLAAAANLSTSPRPTTVRSENKDGAIAAWWSSYNEKKRQMRKTFRETLRRLKVGVGRLVQSAVDKIRNLMSSYAHTIAVHDREKTSGLASSINSTADAAAPPLGGNETGYTGNDSDDESNTNSSSTTGEPSSALELETPSDSRNVSQTQSPQLPKLDIDVEKERRKADKKRKYQQSVRGQIGGRRREGKGGNKKNRNKNRNKNKNKNRKNKNKNKNKNRKNKKKKRRKDYEFSKKFVSAK